MKTESLIQLVKYEYNKLIKEAEEIIRILTAIVKTSQKNLTHPPAGGHN